MDIYVVLDRDRVVGASTKLQGGELIRAEEAGRLADRRVAGRITPPVSAGAAYDGYYAQAYDRMRVENVELRDVED